VKNRSTSVSTVVKMWLILISLAPTYAFAQTCLTTGYTVGFFNGVWNTVQQANEGKKALQNLIGDIYKSEPVVYESFYNTTGSVAGATALQDLAEVFIQRANEVDNSGELGRRFEFFWESLAGDKSDSDKIIDAFPAAASIFSELATVVATKIGAGWSLILSNPPTQSDYARHNARLQTLVSQGQKLLLVAHSQGNLFVNQAYDFSRLAMTTDSVKTVHIAPASPTLRGDYVLADIDLVINGLNSFGFSSVPAQT
jgi:hypothetical protein